MAPGADLCGVEVFPSDWLRGENEEVNAATGSKAAIYCVAIDIVEAWDEYIHGLGYEFHNVSFQDPSEFLHVIRGVSLQATS